MVFKKAYVLLGKGVHAFCRKGACFFVAETMGWKTIVYTFKIVKANAYPVLLG